MRCNKHEALRHDFFVSYRVVSDKVVAEKLATILDGSTKPNGDNYQAYLDKNCLLQGKDWEQGFLNGINHSSVILLLISEKAVDRFNNAEKWQDNVLLEWQFALQLQADGKADVYAVYIASQENTPDNKPCYVKYNDFSVDRFPAGIHKANDVANQLNIRDTIRKVYELKSVHIEPDSIIDKVPNIKKWWIKAAEKYAEPSMLLQLKSPTSGSRMQMFGVLMGILIPVISLSFLLIETKSKRHGELKSGTALGNVLIFVIGMGLVAGFAAKTSKTGNSLQCVNCEFFVSDDVTQLDYSDYYLAQCSDYCNTNTTSSDCINCICDDVYIDCDGYYADATTLMISIPVLMILAVVTLITARTTSAAARQMEL